MEEQRLTNLEIRFSHQEDFIRELNKVVIAQQAAIGRLEKEILDLKRNVNTSSIDSNRTLQDDKPPHY